MPNPDITPYVDLRLFDKDAQEVFDAALANARTYLPDWEPREGNTEVVLLESMALEVADNIFAINRLPGAIMEVLLRLYGIARDLGTPPTAWIAFTLVDSLGYDLPAGIRVAVPVTGEEALVFTTTVPVSADPGTNSVSAYAVADRSTAAANGTPVSTPIEMLDSVATVERVDLASEPTGGTDPEDDLSWFSRGAQRFSRLAETLVLPEHFTAAALEEPLVERAFTIDNYDPGQAGGVGTHPGHVTVAVYGNNAAVSTATKNALAARFEAAAQANLAVHIADPTVTNVEVDATVTIMAGYTSAQVQANALAALQAYLSPSEWKWSGTVYRNELIALLDRVEGVDRVVSIANPAADLALPGVAPLARLNVVTSSITVV